MIRTSPASAAKATACSPSSMAVWFCPCSIASCDRLPRASAWISGSARCVARLTASSAASRASPGRLATHASRLNQHRLRTRRRSSGSVRRRSTARSAAVTPLASPDKYCSIRLLAPQVGPVLDADQGLVLEHRPVVRDRLPVRPRGGRLAGGPRTLAEHGLEVSARDRVVHEAARVGVAERDERIQDTAVEDHLPCPGDRPEHGHPGELVPERDLGVDDVQQPGLLGRRQPVPRIVHESGREPRLDGAGDHRELLDEVTGVRREAGEALDRGTHHRRRGRRRRARQDLGDQVGVAGGEVEDLVGVHLVPVAQRPDRLGRQRRQREGGRGGGRGRHQGAESRRGRLVVPERHDEEGADRGEPTRGVPEHVEGALVGPVQVLDDQHRGGSVVEGRDQRRHDQVAVAGLDGGPELRTEARCDVLHRTECSRSGQGVAVAGEHAGPRGHPGVERPYQRRLADTRLTGDEYDGAAPLVGRSSGRGQDAQLLAALQEPPGHPLTTSPASRSGPV